MTDITLLGHSAVKLVDGNKTLVLDPGLFSDLNVLEAANAVLITHGHADHVAASALVNVAADVWAPEDVVVQLEEAGCAPNRLHAVGPGETFTAAGFKVEVIGGQHAQIYPGLPSSGNNGYLIDGKVLHTGDSLAPVSDPTAVEILLLPVAAPWLLLADAINYARGHEKAIVLPIHDGILSAPGKQLTDNVLTAILGANIYKRPAQEETVSI